MSEGSPSQKKNHSSNDDLEGLSKVELIHRIKEQDQYIKQLESKRAKMDKADDDVDINERLKQQQKDAARSQNTLVHRLTTKEQELQDYVNQIAEIKQAQTQGATQLRSMLLDPAVNITFQRMTKEMDDAQEKLKQTQNELSAWKFTPDSQTGKRLMARCQMLLQENEELGKTIASGRTAKLEGEIALQKTLVTEMKNNQSELDEFLGDLEEDVEGMQTMIYVLQQQLKESKEQISTLEQENAKLRGEEYQTFNSKDKEGIGRTRKPENTNQNMYNESSEYQSMDTAGYYQNEKTDSDLEAEYNYEGLYENEDKYQEEYEQQQSESTSNQYEYEEKFKDYDEIYETDGKTTATNNGTPQENEAMEVEVEEDNHTHDKKHTLTPTLTPPDSAAYQAGATRSTSYKPVHSPTNHKSHIDPPSHLDRDQSMDTESSGQLIDSTSGEADCIQKGVIGNTSDSRTTASDSSAECTPTENLHADANCKEISTTKARTPEHVSRNSLKDDKPNKTNSQLQTSSTNGKSNSSNSVSPSKDTAATEGKSEHNPSQQVDKLTEADSSANSCSAADSISPGKDRSPVSSSGTVKEREPVLQKFLNGVTSTVDDIVDL